MPNATSRTSALTASHRLAISLMNDTLVARKAFEAYLISSADAASVTRIGARRLRYSSETRTATPVSWQPITTRVGSRKSCTAAPSRRNSGFDATPIDPVGTPASARRRSTRAVVPTGTVDLLITTAPGRRTGAISRTTSSTIDRSAAPSSCGGVGTQRNTYSAVRAAVAAPTTNVSRRAASPSATSAGRPSSSTGTSPLLSRATFSRSTSPHTTSWPSRAKHAAVVSPTYPPPMTAIALTCDPVWARARGRGLRQRSRTTRGQHWVGSGGGAGSLPFFPPAVEVAGAGAAVVVGGSVLPGAAALGGGVI